MKKILISLLLIILGLFLFGQDSADKYIEQDLNQKLNSFFIESNKELDTFIKSLSPRLVVELNNKLLKINDAYSESIYEYSFEISKILNYIKFYMEDYGISTKDLSLDVIFYIVDKRKTFIEIPKDFLIEYYLSDYKKQNFMIGQLLGLNTKK